MPVMQLMLLAFFTLDAWLHFWMNWGLLVPCIITGKQLSCLSVKIKCHSTAWHVLHVHQHPPHVQFVRVAKYELCSRRHLSCVLLGIHSVLTCKHVS